ALGLAELARARLGGGFPWGSPAEIWIDTPLAQTLALAGPHALAVATLAAAAAPALAGRPLLALRLALAAALALGAAWLWGADRLARAPEPAPARARAIERPAETAAPAAVGARVVRLVQPNAAQRLKWDPARAPLFQARLLAGTAMPPAPGLAAPALVVWPETAITAWLERAGPVLAAADLARARAGAERLVLGARRSEGLRMYNSLVLLGPGATIAGLYDKHRLVPFGEYLPGADLLARLGFRALAAERGFSPGPGPTLIGAGALGRFQPLICYEAIFPQEILGGARRPDFLVQITNDAWFGELAGPQQHLVLARMRAIEQGLPLLRAANTGISAVIDPWGRITGLLPLGAPGVLDAELPAPLAPTPYGRFGDAALALLLAGWLGGATLRAAVRRALRQG
ncbi:MAG: apolipoprotein N-acyltransferase, partial [Alphaproteobacteria bacterium]